MILVQAIRSSVRRADETVNAARFSLSASLACALARAAGCGSSTDPVADAGIEQKVGVIVDDERATKVS